MAMPDMWKAIHIQNLHKLAEQNETAGREENMKFEKTMRTIGIVMAVLTMSFILLNDQWAEPKNTAFTVCMADDQI